MKRFVRIIGLIAALLVLGTFSAGFLYYQKNLKPVYVTSATQAGKHLEDYFPLESSFFVFVDAKNEEQRAKTDELLKRIGGKTSQDYVNDLADNLIKDGTLTRDAAMELTQSPRIALGGALPTFNLGAKKTVKKTDAALYVVFETPKAIDLANAINTLPDSRELNQQGKKEKVFAAASGDVIVFSTDPVEKIEALAHRKMWEKKSLSQSHNFKKYAIHFEQNSPVNLYVEMPQVLVVGSFFAGEEGFSMNSWSHIITTAQNEDVARKMLSIYTKEHSSLIKNISTNGLLLFVENFDLATQFSLQPAVGDFIKKSVGIDLEKDIGDTVTDFVMQDVGQPIPALSLYLDTSANQNVAGGSSFGILKKLDEQINKLIIFANYTVKTDPVKGPFASRTAVVNTGISATRITLHPENVADGVALPPFISQLANSLAITYGTVQRGDFAMTFISTNPFIIENLANEGLWGVGTDSLSKYRDETMKNGGLSYIAVGKFGDSIARIIELIDASSSRPVSQTGEKSAMSKVAVALREKSKKFGGLYAVTGTDGEGIVQKILLKIVK